MALLSSSMTSTSSSNYYRKTSTESMRHSNTQASAYVVDADTMALTSFHFSTSGAGGMFIQFLAHVAASAQILTYSQEWSGGFEVPSGVPSPPPSPDAVAFGRRPGLKARSRSGDAAHHITEECERLFCETLKAVFLVEKDTGLENSLVVDAHIKNINSSNIGRPAILSPARDIKQQSTVVRHNLPTPVASPDTKPMLATTGPVKEYIEMYDYAGGARFRGFVAEKRGERAMFVFFDKEVIGQDLKPGLMALLDLATDDHFECSQLWVAIDRAAEEDDAKEITRNLGWVGFELTMLDQWAGCKDCMSDRWLFLSMDI